MKTIFKSLLVVVSIAFSSNSIQAQTPASKDSMKLQNRTHKMPMDSSKNNPRMSPDQNQPSKTPTNQKRNNRSATDTTYNRSMKDSVK